MQDMRQDLLYHVETNMNHRPYRVPPYDMHVGRYPDLEMGRMMPPRPPPPRPPPPLPPRDMYYEGGDSYLEKDIARELSRFRGPDPRLAPAAEYYPHHDPYLERDHYERDLYADRGRDFEYEQSRVTDYHHREKRRDRDDYRDERDRDRYREDREYRSRDKSWDDDDRRYDRRDRERDRDRDYDCRSRSGRDDYDRDESRRRRERTTRWDDGYEEHRERKREEKDRSKRSERDSNDAEFKSENEPTSVIMLRGLRDEIKEDDILEELYAAEVAFKDVRIVRNKIGYTRGFGFVEFEDVEAAKQWMDQIKGRLVVQGFTIGADFSRPKNTQDKDWNCSKCGTQNFSSRRRQTCFSCGNPKEASTVNEEKESTNAPCKVLILKGLDVLTNEETVRTVLSSITTLPIFDIRLIRDKLTSTSRGFCFVELSSVEDATSLLEQLTSMNPPFEIDGRIVNTLYAKNSEPAPTVKSNVATAAIEQAQWSSTQQNSGTSAAAATAIAQAQAASLSSYSQYQQAQPIDSSQDPTSQTQAAGAAANPSLPGFIGPPMSSFVYDAASGYYYDASSGLYYDTTTQYFYNSTTGQYSYWDANTQQYIPVAADGSTLTTSADAAVAMATTTPSTTSDSTSAATISSNTTTATTTATTVEDSISAKEKEKKAKSLQAKKIAKDMERWARNVNTAKAKHHPAEETKKLPVSEEPEFKKPSLPPPKLLTVLTKVSRPADMIEQPVKVMSSPLSGMIPSKKDDDSSSGSKWSSIVAEYGEDDDDDQESEPEEPVNSTDKKFADLKLMACLLCKRQFPNREGLDRHMHFSDLHKQNLEVHRKMNMTEKQREDFERRERESKYRDRAKERREKYNQPDVSSFSQPPSRKRKGFQPTSKYEQPTKEGIGEDNIGNQMLRAMGWSQGSGLGKEGQGIVDPIKAQMRTQYAGLGSAGSSYGSVTGAESAREKRQKLAMSRFNDT